MVEQLLPEMVPLYDCPQEPEWHPEGDVWTHTLMVIDEARRRNGDLDRAPLAIDHAGRGVPRPRQAGRRPRMIDGRIRSPGHEDAGVAPATAFLDRLNIHTMDGCRCPRRRCSASSREHLRPGAFFKARDDGRRRRVPAPRAEGGSGAADALRARRLPWARRRLRLLGDGLVHRARTLARRGASARRRRS